MIAIGRAFTKKIDEHVAAEKEYIASLKLGETSTTDDAEGDKNVNIVESVPTHDDVLKVVQGFIGEITQIPPAYSAIKINGQEAYKRVRRGEEVVMRPRQVHIDTIEILTYHYPVLNVRVVCGKGTYIRSLARDMGKELNTGGYLSDLQRTRVGNFTIENAFDCETFDQERK